MKNSSLTLESIIVDNRKVELFNVRPKVGEYTVYNNKIWKITLFEMKKYKPLRKLERIKTNEVVIIKNKECNNKLKTIIKPSGHISI